MRSAPEHTRRCDACGAWYIIRNSHKCATPEEIAALEPVWAEREKQDALLRQRAIDAEQKKLTTEKRIAIERAWNEEADKEKVSRGQLAAWEETKRLQNKDQSDIARAFRAYCKLERTQKELSKPSLFSATRRNLKKKADSLEEELADISENGREMVRLLTIYVRRHDAPNLTAEDYMRAWMRGERDDVGTYCEFVDWCRDKHYELRKLKRQKKLSEQDALLIPTLAKLVEIDTRSIQKRLTNQFGAHGRPGRRRNEKTKG